MKKTILYLAVLTAVLASCEKEPNAGDEAKKDEQFQEIAENFLDKTVYPTYAALADKTEELNEAMASLKTAPSQNALNNICTIFLEARAEWELSEAFLFGAATDFGIDPHIDSWPLDEDSFNDLMSSPNILKNLEGDEGAEYAGAKLGNELLGFHGIEYILFKEGKSRSISEITSDMLTYAVAVSGDLRNRTAQLDVAWRGDAAPKTRRDLVEELELSTTVGGGDFSYGENLLKAGEAGSLFYSKTHAMQCILQACSTIVDEVGTSKIGKAHNGEDVSYIESPYSYNSIVDFYDNIVSVANVYYGGREGSRNKEKSLSAWFMENDASIASAMDDAIENALSKIKGMKAPFVLNYTDKSAEEAINACSKLDEVISRGVTSLAQ